ncbi:hypothetical protein GF327_07995 [Candidatus Woesearchaeota archaeon]|nr:hypothetical protein [Candidatus Woesearchaeota archaeon]
MVTRYDVFELMYSKGTLMKPKEVARAFRSADKEYHAIYMILVDLQKRGLVSKTEHGFRVKRNEKNDLLNQMIMYCISNSVNYNDLLDENIAEFIARALSLVEFTIKDFDLNSRTYSKYVHTLAKHGFLVILSQKPLRGFVPFNHFLKDVAEYFGFDVKKRRVSDDEYFDEIKRELEKFRRLRFRNVRAYQRIIEDFEIKFVHHSLSLEGNPITLPDTVKILKQQVTPLNLNTVDVAEVQNYQRAMEQMMADVLEKNPLSVQAVLNYHYLAMRHRPDIAGKLRTLPVHIRKNPDFEVAEVEEIRPKLEVLFSDYNEFMPRKGVSLREILDFASYFHNEFQHIHPFIDGNSRTTRLITFHLLRTQDVPVFDIPLGLLESYLDSTKGAKKREDTELNQMLQLVILYNLKTINEKLT